MQTEDKLIIGGHEFESRFILGSGKYSMKLIEAAVRDAGAQIITLAVRRANTKEHENILDYIPKDVTLLPNTSGARNAQEAVRIARLARELGCGNFVKVEIMRDSKYLLPDNQETIKATELLAKEGFVVMPYMYPDLNPTTWQPPQWPLRKQMRPLILLWNCNDAISRFRQSRFGRVATTNSKPKIWWQVLKPVKCPNVCKRLTGGVPRAANGLKRQVKNSRLNSSLKSI